MAQSKNKKITLGTIVGVIIVVGIFIAKQQGWLPAKGGDDANSRERTTQNDAPNESASTNNESNTGDTQNDRTTPPDRQPTNPRQTQQPTDDGGIGDLFRSGTTDTMVTVTASVKKILPDDNDGHRHQRIIMRLSTGATLLLAHNIDLAERIPCDEGDVLTMRGEYEWSEQGGVIHWTHHNPAGRNGRHAPGWIDYDGVRYE